MLVVRFPAVQFVFEPEPPRRLLLTAADAARAEMVRRNLDFKLDRIEPDEED